MVGITWATLAVPGASRISIKGCWGTMQCLGSSQEWLASCKGATTSVLSLFGPDPTICVLPSTNVPVFPSSALYVWSENHFLFLILEVVFYFLPLSMIGVAAVNYGLKPYKFLLFLFL